MPAPVTVVVVTRDRERDLRRSLPEHAPYPVVVVDNGSRDGSVAVARKSGARVVALGRNAGAAARTVGVELAGTPYVAFADDDSWWAGGALEQAAALLDGHPRLGLLAARVLVGPEQRPDPVSELMAGSPLPATPGLPGPAVLGFVACGAVVRRDAYLEVGGFREQFGIGGEEELLALDLAAAGWLLAYVESVVACHHPSPSRDPARRRVVQRRNALYTTFLRRPLPVAARAVAGAIRDGEGRAALREVVREIGWVLRERRAVPDGVEAQVRLLERA